MIAVDGRLESRIIEAGFERTGDCDGNARYAKGDNTILVSGYMVLVRAGGFWRPFSIEYALIVGIRLLEKLARIIPKAADGHRLLRMLAEEMNGGRS